MERVWSQYERMESELSVIRSHLQHICNFGGPQVFQLHILTSLGFQAWLTAFKTLFNTINQKHIYFCFAFCFVFFTRSSLRPKESCGWWRTSCQDWRLTGTTSASCWDYRGTTVSVTSSPLAKLRLEDLCRNFKRISKIELIKKKTHIWVWKLCVSVLTPFYLIYKQ